MRGFVRRGRVRLRQRWGTQSPRELEAQAEEYWTTDSDSIGKNSHWRGHGPFADDDLWLSLGARHWRMYEEMSAAVSAASSPRRLGKVVEWGCGGGMNAVHFAGRAQSFFAVDIYQGSLDECRRQVAAENSGEVVPLLVDPGAPEAAVADIGPGSVDLFLCTYVYEVLPTPEYGLALLAVVRKLLGENGLAIIQVKYSGPSREDSSRRWNYRANLAWNATYRIEEFWTAAAEAGLEPRLIELVPVDPAVGDRNYAYFCLTLPRDC